MKSLESGADEKVFIENISKPDFQREKNSKTVDYEFVKAKFMCDLLPMLRQNITLLTLSIDTITWRIGSKRFNCRLFGNRKQMTVRIAKSCQVLNIRFFWPFMFAYGSYILQAHILQ